ncbi:DUF3108 domain-containing protein [Alphaproteobacteria bacterium]|nr:DUF3108 domain-containing protein [Alphaproteobacteria bacterium]
MKLILNSFFIYLFFVCAPVFGEGVVKKYEISVNGIKIGKLSWEFVINNENYRNNIKLKSEGILSALYKFEGEYFSEGKIKNKILKPKRYTHLWKTKKQTKKMSLIFGNNKVKSIKQTPDEKEYLRINVFSEEKTKDPLSSFLQIIMGMKSSLVIDGRRLYTMSAVSPNGANKTIIQLINYSNLWADHKRSKFEKIVFEKNSKDFLPSKIFIYFDKRVFRLQ